ncbi:hypothetical protein TWF694_000333 [Orbilia ellipsospora]|uniref:B30.2/SPRY domain-containing protein n=1 Tax=Orbilia ellipsospora TaxID=2528407 RepID=A0AAV9XNA1_9PEZI
MTLEVLTAVKEKEKPSECWEIGKKRFLDELQRSDDKPEQKAIERFFRSNVRLDATISKCEFVKTNAETQYSQKKSSKFLGKLLDVLTTVKAVADPFLQNGPETVSIAWCAVSFLIDVAAKDKDNCDFISEACTNIVTMVFNCRIYEQRYHNKSEEYQSDELEITIRATLPKIIAMILNFLWHSQNMLGENKAFRGFKETFNPKLRPKYQTLMDEYFRLRELSKDAFQERVMDSLAEMERKIDGIQALLFPSLNDLKNQMEEVSEKLSAIRADIQKHKSNDDINKRFQTHRDKLRPSKTHSKLLKNIIAPLPDDKRDDLCKWLFEDGYHYRDWEQSSRLPQSDKNPPAQLVDRNIFYIKGRPGFGKSVMMALATKRLVGMENVVAYFFFRKGDDASQLTRNALSSLAAQLFNEKFADTMELKERFINLIEGRGEKKYNTESGKDSGEAAVSVAQNLGASDKETSPIPIDTNQGLKNLIQSIGMALRAVGKSIYLVIDGIDECSDRDQEDLVTILADIARSSSASFRLLLSSRHDMGPGDVLSDYADLAAKAATQEDCQNQHPFDCYIRGDTTIITLDENSNSADMTLFLKYKLWQLLTRGESKSNRNSSYGTKLEDNRRPDKLSETIDQIVEQIKEKANGMFTYSAVVMASLTQPSRMTLKERLNNLPKGMDELYQRRLALLTIEERELVSLALKRIVFSAGPIRTLEIAEEFKQVYQQKETFSNNDYNIPDIITTREESDCGSVAGGDDLIDEAQTTKDMTATQHLTNTESINESISSIDKISLEVPNVAQSKVSRHASNGYEIQKAMKDQEVIETIYHLRNAGRDFFKFSNESNYIDVVHKSIRDWVENEAKSAAEEMDRSVGTIKSIFPVDSRGQVMLTLAIPNVFLKGQAGSMDFQTEKDIQLDILLYLMEVITAPAFQKKYMPFTVSTQKMKQDSVSPKKSPLYRQKREFRYEIIHWHTHMKRVEELWPRESRRGEKWERLHKLINKFIHPESFKRYVVTFWLKADRTSVEEACDIGLDFEPIHLAAYYGLQILLDHLTDIKEIDVNSLNGHGHTALHWFEWVPFPAIVEKLLERGGDVTVKDVDGDTPLAIWVGWTVLSTLDVENPDFRMATESLRYLLRAGADPNVRGGKRGPTALGVIVAIEDMDMFEMVMGNETQKIDVNFADGSGRTILHTLWTERYNHIKPEKKIALLERLIAAGGDVNAQDNDSRAPLYYAVTNGSVRGVEILLDKGADVDDDDIHGKTAITALFEQNENVKEDVRVELLELLLERNANIELPSRNSKLTPIMVALINGYYRIAEILKAKNLEKTSGDYSFLMFRDWVGRTIFHFCAWLEPQAGMKVAKFVAKDLNKAQLGELLGYKEKLYDTTAFEAAIEESSIDLALYFSELVDDIKILNSDDWPSFDTLILQWASLVRQRGEPHGITADKATQGKDLFLRLMNLAQSAVKSNPFWLQVAISTKVKIIVEALAKAGADPCEKHAGWDAFDVAYAHGQEEMVRSCFPNFGSEYFSSEAIGAKSFRHFGNLDNCDWDEDGLSVDTKGIYVLVEFHPSGFTAGTFTPRIRIPPHYSIFYFEVTISSSEGDSQKASISIGMTSFKFSPTCLPGFPGHGSVSFGYYGGDGKLYSSEVHDDDGKQFKEFQTGKDWSFGTGDTIGCGYDRERRHIFYTKNGVYIGVAFRNVLYALVPGVGFKDASKVKINFGGEEFEWKDMSESDRLRQVGR